MIRPYAPEDLDQLLDVWLEASRLAHPFLDESFLERERDQIANVHLASAETWVWDHDGEVVGFIALIENEVGGLFVLPSSHGRGIGRALMDHAGARLGALELSVFEANSIGRGFYEAYGFRLAGRRIHEPTGQSELRMRWTASGGSESE